MCVVQIEKFRAFQPACATCINEGMVINTDTPEVHAARKLTLELILSDHAVDCHHCMRIGSSKCDDLDPKFCEMCFFCDCVRDGFCELQSLVREYKVDALPFEQRGFDRPLDESTGSIIRNPNKCIKCRRCVDVCNDVQTVYNLCDIHRGTETAIVPALNRPMAENPCVQCGRCVEVCPTGAIFSLEHKDELLYNTHKYSVTTVVQISRNVLPALAELFKMDAGPDIRLVAAGLRKIGVNFVVSDNFALSEVQKQATATIEKVLKTPGKPVVLTNSPAAEKFAARNFPDIEVTTYPSVQQYSGDYVRTKFAKEKGLDPAKVKDPFNHERQRKRR